MGDAGVLRGWEELGCSDPNMPPDVRSDGVFFDFFSVIRRKVGIMFDYTY